MYLYIFFCLATLQWQYTYKEKGYEQSRKKGFKKNKPGIRGKASIGHWSVIFFCIIKIRRCQLKVCQYEFIKKDKLNYTIYYKDDK